MRNKPRKMISFLLCFMMIFSVFAANITVTVSAAAANFTDIKIFALKVNYTASPYTRYVTIGNNSILYPTASALSSAALFDVKTVNGKSGMLSRDNGMLVCAEDNPQQLRARTNGANDPDAWEWFDIELRADGAIALIATGADWAANKYVYAASNTTGALLRPSAANSNTANLRVEIEVVEYANPPIPATSVILNINEATITEFEGTVQLSATGLTPADASNMFLQKLVTWSSSDDNVAVVDANGLVTGIGEGEAVIYAHAGGTSGACAVTVDIETVEPTGITVNPAARDLTLGFTAQLYGEVLPINTTSRKITWSSDNSAVAAVDANGLVTAVSAGAAVITGTTANGFSAACAITVKAPSDGKPNIYRDSAVGSDDVIVYVKNVLDFGASGDGVSDNTAAFQAAVYAARDAGGGVVFAPAGIYRFNGRLHVPSGVTLRGEWKSPLKGGGKGEGTILAVYADRGKTKTLLPGTSSSTAYGGVQNPDNIRSFIGLDSSGTVRDLSFWWPEQTIDNVVPYPYAIGDDSGYSGNDVINVMNVTMYNAYRGVMSYGTHGCTTVRNMFGTILSIGISEDSGFDIGRMENICFDPSYWADSGLPGAPAYSAISAYTRANAIGIDMWQDDWGYMFNLNFNHMKTGLEMNDGNCAVSNMTTRNVDTAINMKRISYPGFQISNSDLEASEACINFDITHGNFYRIRSEGSNKNERMQGVEQVAAANVKFCGNPKTAIIMNIGGALGNPMLSLQNCTFDGWQNYAVNANKGSVIIMDSEFKQPGRAVRLTSSINAANILGNRFNNYTDGVTIESAVTPAGQINIVNDFETDYPQMPVYEYEFAPVYKPADADKFYNVLEPGNGLTAVTANGLAAGRTDQTAGLQAILDYAGDNGGGTVFMPGGTYWIAGSVTVPSGVELRGSYDASHTGKNQNTTSSSNGTVIAVYSDSAPSNGSRTGTATVNVSADASLRGVTFYYPNQNITSGTYGNAGVTSVNYPWAVRGLGANCFITNNTLVNAYNGIDLMTYRCDGAVLADMNAYALGTQVQMGGGMAGGWVQDVHFNQCNWQQSNWPTSFSNLDNYAGAKIVGFKYGAMKDVYNFQNFTITCDKAIWMVEEPGKGEYGGLFHGTFNGFAFDSNQVGLQIENAGEVIFINAMCVTDLPRGGVGGPNIRTGGNFTGTVYYYNGDSWGNGTQTCEVNGGTVYMIQYNSWCSPKATVNSGGKLYIIGSLYMHQGGISGSDLIVNSTAGPAVFMGNIGYNRLPITNNALNKLTAKYNLITSGATVPEYGILDYIIEVKKADNAPVVVITNVQLSEEPISGAVEMLLPPHLASLFGAVRFEDLAYGASVEIVYPPLTVDLVKFKVTPDGGTPFTTETFYIGTACAGRKDTPGEPTKDGELPALVIDSSDYISIIGGGSPWTGPDDLSAEAYFKWDSSNLYLYVAVKDDVHYNDITAAANIWQGDCLQVGIDIRGPSVNQTSFNEVGFALNNNGTILRNAWTRPTGVNAPPAAISNMTVNITRDESAKTTTYDLIIPFNTVGTAANINDALARGSIGIALFINDADENRGAGDDRRITAEAKSGQLKSSAEFGTLYFLGAGVSYIDTVAAAKANYIGANGSAGITAQNIADNFTKLMNEYTYFTITASAGTGAAITPSGAEKLKFGSELTYTITADVDMADYDVTVKVDGVPVEVTFTDNAAAYTFADVTADHTIDVTAAIKPIEFVCAVKTLTASVGVQQTIAYSYSGPESGRPAFSSSNAGICAVDNDGMLTPIKAGMAIITVKCGAVTVTIVVTVK